MLGFDPTMEAVSQSDDRETQYDIVVRSRNGEERVYRTLGLLSNTGGSNLLCRGTRVWRAVPVENGRPTGDPVALKDSWVDASREREGLVNMRIREAAAELAQVPLRTAVSDDARPGSPFEGSRSPVGRTVHEAIASTLMTVITDGDVFVNGATDCTKSLPEEFIDSDSDHLIHYRIISKEIGRPLQGESSLATIFEVLSLVTDSACLLMLGIRD